MVKDAFSNFKDAAEQSTQQATIRGSKRHSQACAPLQGLNLNDAIVCASNCRAMINNERWMTTANAGC